MPDLFRSQGKSVPLFFPLRALPLLDLIRPGSRLIVHPLESKLTIVTVKIQPIGLAAVYRCLKNGAESPKCLKE
jgi:hypothetical protein